MGIEAGPVPAKVRRLGGLAKIAWVLPEKLTDGKILIRP